MTLDVAALVGCTVEGELLHEAKRIEKTMLKKTYERFEFCMLFLLYGLL